MFLLLISCSRKEAFDGFSYDPPNSTDTRDRGTESYQPFALELENRLSIEADFPGARIFNPKLENQEVVLESRAENYPVNNSPWFAFKVQTSAPDWYQFRIRFRNARSRYVPKLSRDGENFAPLDADYFQMEDSVLSIRIFVDQKPLWISAQELQSSKTTDLWMDHLAKESFIRKERVGTSVLGREIHGLRIGSKDASQRLIIIGRQHPPELSGDLGLKCFVEALTDSSTLMAAFRQETETIVIPMINPDGVDLGHWRHNANGVDLNRDWANFNQPETRAVKSYLKSLQNDNKPIVFSLDFHSTDSLIFYPVKREFNPKNGSFASAWLSRVSSEFKEFPISIQAFDLSAPIFKNWMFRTHGADGVTYEFPDEMDRELIQSLSRLSAYRLAEILSPGE